MVRLLPLPKYRRWESPTAGFVFELEGPDPQSVTMPPAPALQDSVDGEQTAIGILGEQALTYQHSDQFRLGFTTFDGEECIVGS